MTMTLYFTGCDSDYKRASERKLVETFPFDTDHPRQFLDKWIMKSEVTLEHLMENYPFGYLELYDEYDWCMAQKWSYDFEFEAEEVI